MNGISSDICKYIVSWGYRCACLPSYTPELNPTEQFWSVVTSEASNSIFNGHQHQWFSISARIGYCSSRRLPKAGDVPGDVGYAGLSSTEVHVGSGQKTHNRTTDSVRQLFHGREIFWQLVVIRIYFVLQVEK
ncbi:hypothetical protein VTP01DRAFT_904 [Rhizomucor pusillus]|uniref:uncharacterized protein n=1 Tax=Rhizomucor pusillus TaxID=4840 RepID=UPI003743B268